jgi:DNA recombination protein RmuC
MSALLNSLQMGFQTLAVQKKSADVWNVLENVKMEFDKFEKVVESIQKKFTGLTGDFDDLVGRRTRAIQRKLRDVQVLDAQSTPLAISASEE